MTGPAYAVRLSDGRYLAGLVVPFSWSAAAAGAAAFATRAGAAAYRDKVWAPWNGASVVETARAARRLSGAQSRLLARLTKAPGRAGPPRLRGPEWATMRSLVRRGLACPAKRTLTADGARALAASRPAREETA